MLFAQTTSSSAAAALRLADYLVLVGYCVLMLAVGAYFYRFMRGIKDYFSGGNNIPWWISGISFYMSSFSVFAFVSYSALAFRYGWVGVTLLWVTVPATISSVLLFAKKWRRARIDSPIEYLEARYSPALRQLFAWQGVPVKMVDDGLKLAAMGTFISVSLGVDMKQSMLWSGLIILAYTFMGGLWAVAVTDFIQFVVMAVAVLILLPLSLSRVGGWGAFVAGAPPGFFTCTTREYDWVYIVLLSLLYCVAWSSVNWPLIQRYYCVKDEREAAKVGWFVTALNLVGPPLMLLPAMAARQFLGAVPDKEVFPRLCIELLPAGLLGLIVAAMFAATMSMLSSDYNICAGVLTNDVYRRLIRKNASQKELLLAGRALTLLIGAVTLGVAFLMAAGTGEDLFKNMVRLFGVVTGPVGIPMILGLLTRRITNGGAFAGWICGLVAGLAMLRWGPAKMLVTVHGLFHFTLEAEISIFLFSSLVTLVVTVVVTLLLPAGPVHRKRVESFYQRLRTPIGELPGDIPDSSEIGTLFSPLRVVGTSLLAVGLMLLAVLPWVTGDLALELTMGFGLILVGLGGGMMWQRRSSSQNRPP